MPKPGADALAAVRAAEAEDVASKAATARHAAVTSLPRRGAGEDGDTGLGKSQAQDGGAAGRLPKKRSPPQSRTSKKSALRKLRVKGWPPESKNCRRNWPQPMPSCNQSSMPSRLRASLPTPPRDRSDRGSAGRARAARALQHGIGCLSAAKTQHLYVRRAFEPDPGRITGRDPGARRPIGTHVSLRPQSGPMAETGCDGASSPWKAGVSHGDVVDRRAGAEPRALRASRQRRSRATRNTALDLIVIPPEVLRIAEMASPRSSLIISDEELSPETGIGHGFRRPPER